jgi:transcriptional regulator with XRE-family HTH domain
MYSVLTSQMNDFLDQLVADYEPFSLVLREILDTRDISQKELQHYLQIYSKSEINRWMLGKSLPHTLTTIRHIADKLDCSELETARLIRSYAATVVITMLQKRGILE